MSRRLSESERRHKYSYYVTNSPLKSNKMPSLSIPEEKGKEKTKQQRIFENMKRERERSFVLDGVHEHTQKSNVLPSYNAYYDPHAVSYFRQPAIQVMLKQAAQKDGHLIPPAIPTHKLSTRKRIPHTPGNDATEHKESRFIIDSIRSDSLKSRRHPVIPQYDALNDLHAKNYFRKKSVRILLQRTCDLKI